MIIYKIENKINGKCYIGQTTQTLAERIKGHKKKNACRYIYRAIQKYGIDNFYVSVLHTAETREELAELEKLYIIEYNSVFPNGYNLTWGGEINKVISEDTRKRLSESHKGIPVTVETRKKLSEANKGKKRSEESKLNMKNSWTADRRKNHYAKGEKHPMAKLNVEKVKEIKIVLVTEEIDFNRIKEIAEQYKVSYQAIYGIKYGTTWKEII